MTNKSNNLKSIQTVFIPLTTKIILILILIFCFYSSSFGQDISNMEERIKNAQIFYVNEQVNKKPEIYEGDRLVCKLKSAEIYYAGQKSINYLSNETSQKSTEELRFKLEIFGPEKYNLIPRERLSSSVIKGGKITIAEDEIGKNLVSNKSSISHDSNYYTFTQHPITMHGEATITGLQLPSKDAKILKLLEGYLTVHNAEQTSEKELNPLIGNVGKGIAINEEAEITFKVYDDNVEYILEWEEGQDKPYLDIEYYSKDGTKLKRKGGGSSGVNRKIEYQQKFVEAFPPDAYVIIKYPKKVNEIQISFSFKDIPLP